MLPPIFYLWLPLNIKILSLLIRTFQFWYLFANIVTLVASFMVVLPDERRAFFIFTLPSFMTALVLDAYPQVMRVKSTFFFYFFNIAGLLALQAIIYFNLAAVEDVAFEI